MAKKLSKKLTDEELKKVTGGGNSRVARNSTKVRQARTPKRA